MKNLSIPMNRSEILWGWVYLFLQLIVLPYMLTLINLIAGNPLSDAALNFVFFGLNFTCVTVVFHRFLLDSLAHALKNISSCIQAVLWGFALYYVISYMISMAFMVIDPEFYNVNDESISQMTRDNFALMGIGTVLLVPPVEETLYRGLIFRGLYDRSKVLAYAVSTVVFCMIHVLGYVGFYDPITLLLCFFQYVPAGICLAWAYQRSDTLVAPILIHMIINLIGILSMR